MTMITNYLIGPGILISAIIIIINAALIHALRKLKKLETLSFKLISYLSTSDICMSILSIAFMVVLWGFKIRPDSAVAEFLYETGVFFGKLSFAFTVNIAIDRYIHMKHWKNYHIIVTPLRFKIGLVIDVIFCLVSMGAVVIARKVYRAESVAAIFISASYLFFLTVVALIYVKAYKSMVSRLKSVESYSATNRSRVVLNI